MEGIEGGLPGKSTMRVKNYMVNWKVKKRYARKEDGESIKSVPYKLLKWIYPERLLDEDDNG